MMMPAAGRVQQPAPAMLPTSCDGAVTGKEAPVLSMAGDDAASLQTMAGGARVASGGAARLFSDTVNRQGRLSPEL
jgi:hypothetical protein